MQPRVDEHNPYEPSYGNLPTQETPSTVLPPNLLKSLTSLARWQTYFAVIGFLFAGIMIMFVMASFVGAFVGESEMVEAIAGAVVILALAILVYLLPAVILFKAAQSARSSASYAGGSIANVIQSQLSFWRYIGYLSIVMIGLYAMIFFFIMIAAVGGVTVSGVGAGAI